MSKKLSVAEIKERIAGLESEYHNGHKQGEDWWRSSGDVNRYDRIWWIKYTRLLNTRLQELAVKHLTLGATSDGTYVYLAWGGQGHPSSMQWKTEDREVAEAYLEKIRNGEQRFRLPADLEFLYEQKWAVKLYWAEDPARYEEPCYRKEEAIINGETGEYFVREYFFNTEAERDAFVMGVTDSHRYSRCMAFSPDGGIGDFIERDVSKLR